MPGSVTAAPILQHLQWMVSSPEPTASPSQHGVAEGQGFCRCTASLASPTAGVRTGLCLAYTIVGNVSTPNGHSVDATVTRAVSSRFHQRGTMPVGPGFWGDCRLHHGTCTDKLGWDKLDLPPSVSRCSQHQGCGLEVGIWCLVPLPCREEPRKVAFSYLVPSCPNLVGLT